VPPFFVLKSISPCVVLLSGFRALFGSNALMPCRAVRPMDHCPYLRTHRLLSPLSSLLVLCPRPRRCSSSRARHHPSPSPSLVLIVHSLTHSLTHSLSLILSLLVTCHLLSLNNSTCLTGTQSPLPDASRSRTQQPPTPSDRHRPAAPQPWCRLPLAGQHCYQPPRS
jgi:hypothetical protein